MDGHGRDRGGRGPGGRYDVWYVPDAAPQAGMYPGPWGQGRFQFRRDGGAWHDEDYYGHTGAEGVVHRRGAGGRQRGYGYGGPERPEPGRYDDPYRGGPGGSDADRICAWQIMTEDPETVTPDTTVGEVARRMRELDVGVIPVVEAEGEGRLAGVVTDRDLVVRGLADGKDGGTPVRECMTTRVATVGPNDTVHDVLNVMKREQVRRVPVTDREGRLVGIIAQADLAVSYAGLDLQREAEVEEAIERISEPTHPARRGRSLGVRQARRY
jgi:CBS domain-containing protein